MFGWDKESIKEKYNALELNELEEYGILYKDMISICNGYTIDTLNIFKEVINDFITIIKLSNEEKNILLKELLKNEKEKSNTPNTSILDYLTIYNNLPKDIKNMIYFIEKNINYIDNKELKLKKEIITYKDLYNFSYSFFTMINTKYKDKINYLFDNRLINISNNKVATRYALENVTVIDQKENIPYINIINSNTKDMYNALNHEISHAIKFLHDKKVYNALPYTDEACSIYTSFLTCIIDINDNNFFKSFYNYYTNLKCSLIIDYIIKNKSMSLNINKDKIFINQINNFTEFDNKVLEEELPDSPLKYGFSLIIALYLLEIYKKDEEKSFYFYNKLLKYCGNSYKEYFKLIEFPYKNYKYSTDLLLKYDDYFNTELIKRKILK